MDHYATLEVASCAPLVDIRRAYHRLVRLPLTTPRPSPGTAPHAADTRAVCTPATQAMVYHPDKSADDAPSTAADAFQAIQTAWEVLKVSHRTPCDVTCPAQRICHTQPAGVVHQCQAHRRMSTQLSPLLLVTGQTRRKPTFWCIRQSSRTQPQPRFYRSTVRVSPRATTVRSVAVDSAMSGPADGRRWGAGTGYRQSQCV
jgi:hypothetical protein